MAEKPIIVIKLGSAIITNEIGNIDKAVIKKIASEIGAFFPKYRVILVSSGAVSSGKAFLQKYKGSLADRKAAAAIGNPILIQLYNTYFSKQGIAVAQALCERRHFSDRKQFLQLKETFTVLWQNQVLPIVNENDIISDIELKFSDNDELATLLAIGFNAEALIICTSVGGLLNDQKQIIPLVEKLDGSILSFVHKESSAIGLGGMLSKLTFTRLALSLGIAVYISGVSGKKPLAEALLGKNGTRFVPSKSTLKSRQKWLASGSITLGNIVVDAGAALAISKRKSLLSIGIVKAEGAFEAGEVVQLITENNDILGVAKTKLSADAINAERNAKNLIAAHADDIVLL